jgi:hypothetical protein
MGLATAMYPLRTRLHGRPERFWIITAAGLPYGRNQLVRTVPGLR